MKSSLGILPLVVAFISSNAYAEDNSPNLEGVVVTADSNDKAETGALGNRAVIDTPYSLTVVDAKDLEKRGAKSVRQIFINDPSFYTPTSSNTTDWWGMSIRGLPVRNTYADDYPILLYWGGDFPVEAADSVTALKGATGFMYGFGAPGGTVVYNLKKPQEKPQNSFGLEYRTSSIVSANVDHGGELASGFRYRLAVAGEKGTAYNGAGVNRYVGSFAADKTFGERLKWSGNLVYEYSKLDHEPFQFYLDGYDFTGSGGKLPKVSYDYDDFNVDNSYYRTKTLIAASGIEYRVAEDWSVRYQFGFTRKDHYSNKSFADLYNIEGDYGGNIYNFAGRLENYFYQAKLTGSFSTGPVTHDVVAGAGYQRSTSRYGDFYYAWTPDFVGNIYERQDFRVKSIPNLDLHPIGSDQRQTFGFASDTLKLGADWQLIAGARYTYYDKQDVDRNPAVASGYDTRALTPTVALLYKPAPNATLYASYVESLEPGSVVGTRYANAGESLDATVSNQYEVGAKYQGGRIGLEAALFKISRAETMDTTRDGRVYLTQDGRSSFKGFEFSGRYRLTDRLRVGGGFVRLKAAIDEASAANRALLGNRPANAAKWQAVANAEYDVPTIEGLSLHGVVRYYGDTYVTNQNQLKVPGYTIVNVGASYRFKLMGREATLNGNINNLFDKKYWAGGGYSAGNMGEAVNGSIGLTVGW